VAQERRSEAERSSVVYQPPGDRARQCGIRVDGSRERADGRWSQESLRAPLAQEVRHRRRLERPEAESPIPVRELWRRGARDPPELTVSPAGIRLGVSVCLPEQLHRPRSVGLERGASRKRSIQAFLDVPLLSGVAGSSVPGPRGPTPATARQHGDTASQSHIGAATGEHVSPAPPTRPSVARAERAPGTAPQALRCVQTCVCVTVASFRACSAQAVGCPRRRVNSTPSGDGVSSPSIATAPGRSADEGATVSGTNVSNSGGSGALVRQTSW
jgi:hypothetical protein